MSGQEPNRGNAGKGRPKGAVNKTTAVIKDMVLQALENAGGVAYLTTQADENPVAFMSLLAKIMPTQLTGDGGGPVLHEIRRTFMDPAANG